MFWFISEIIFISKYPTWKTVSMIQPELEDAKHGPLDAISCHNHKQFMTSCSGPRCPAELHWSYEPKNAQSVHCGKMGWSSKHIYIAGCVVSSNLVHLVVVGLVIVQSSVAVQRVELPGFQSSESTKNTMFFFTQWEIFQAHFEQFLEGPMIQMVILRLYSSK